MNAQQIATLRQKYLDTLIKVKKEIQSDTNDFFCDTEHVCLTITQKYPHATPVVNPFRLEKDYFDVLNRNIDCTDELHEKSIEINDDARDIMFKEIFKDHHDCSYDIAEWDDGYSNCPKDTSSNEESLANYNFDTLPFPVTRSIYDLEYDLYSACLEHICVCKHNKDINKQIDELELEMHNKAINEQAKEDEKLGYCKNKIVLDVKNLLDKNMYTKGRDNKVEVTRQLFNYLNSAECKRFMNDHKKFELVVKRKLHHFYNVDNLREAKTWYRNLFNGRMPLEIE